MSGVWSRAFPKRFRDDSRVLDEDDVEHCSGLGVVTSLSTSFFGGTLAYRELLFSLLTIPKLQSSHGGFLFVLWLLCVSQWFCLIVC